MVELKMIDNFFLCVTPHLFVVMFILIEDPLEIGDALTKLDLLPYFSLIHDGPHKILVIIAIDNGKGQLFRFANFIDL
jgi:hypothetical protein